MFKHQDTINPQDPSQIQQQNFSQAKDLKIEEMPIRTMAQDLYEVEHPNEKKYSEPEKTIPKQELTEKQKTSPFLNMPEKTQPENNFYKSQSQIKDNPQSKPENITQQTAHIATKINSNTPSDVHYTEKQQDTSKGGVLALILAVIILLVTGAGVYYFLVLNPASLDPNLNAAPPSDPVATSQETALNKEPLTLSAIMPNYMMIDLANSDTSILKNTLSTFTEQVRASNITTPVEFLLVDKENNPVAFAIFVEKLNLKLSPETLSDLGNKFSLFIHNDQSEMRLGLTVEVVNDINLKNDLEKNEKALTENLKNLLIPMDYTFSPANFNTNIYNGIAIRYINATDAKDLSLDYAILNKQLVIGTSKLSTIAIIDKILNDAASSTQSITNP